ncbi:MAG: Unknown protein [uncultured Thiotrichaceae bacterium]|uniref:G domain-containing protein n=1 Tax=uncultured Thiotrichaceae bacterium TaxID=298394 RepID=A0A6S6T8X9_9GAMM|nr:MAG: Unknown protein [uncultured Thiotrichaceae bacterium]
MSAVKQIDQCVSGLLETSSEYLGQEFSDNFSVEYENKKAESLLQIMLFGSYNAGKSSLINALSGSGVAAIGDIPKTATADRYEWNGCYLLDTPGVNAPIEHEALTSDQVKRSELILFVIRQGDQDVKDVYERMFEMLVDKKHVFIVYNHGLSAEELPVAMSRLNGIMVSYAERYNIELNQVSEIPVIPINIKTAIKARFGGKEALAEYSGITEFEGVFQSWFRQFDSEHHYLDRLQKYIHRLLLKPLLDAIDKKLTDGSDSAMKELQSEREQLVKKYNLLNSRVANHIRGEVINIKPEIVSAMEGSSSQVDLEAALNQLADKVVSSTSGFIREYCDSSDLNLDGLSGIPVNMPESADEPSVLSRSIEGALVSGAKSIDSGTIKEGFLLLRKLKIPGIKGRWSSTLGKWAGKANIAVTLATAAYEIYSASSEQDKLNAEQKKQSIGLHQAVEGVANAISSAVLEVSRNALKSVETDMLSVLDSRIAKLANDSGRHTKNLEIIKKFSYELDSVRI